MMRNHNFHTKTLLIGVSLLGLIGNSNLWAADVPPTDRCTGYGNLQSIHLNDWEAGLGTWSVDTHDIANPATFDTPDWASVENLPDDRAGRAAFVANLDSDCGADDQSGALTLDSPSIRIPDNTEVPRISFDHWFDTELEYDGGNIKISVNGAAFDIIPASAFEYGEHYVTLAPAFDNDGLEDNSSPLAGEEAFTGTPDDNQSGSWTDVRINLLGIAAAGDTIKLRFDFGVDRCIGTVGWYVDDVEIYSCAAELPPSDCGNGVLDSGEQCDDGNDFINDGCSNTCQVENGWECTAPGLPGSISDPSFEAGTPNPFWTEVSNNPIGTPICEVAVCGKAGGTGPLDGNFWLNLGSTSYYQEGSVSQSIVIPSSVSTLTFELEIPSCDSAADYMELLIDDQPQLRIDGSNPRCGIVGYETQIADISAYADGAVHEVAFHSETFSNNGGVSSFFIDAIALPGKPSLCTPTGGTRLTLIKKVINDNGGFAAPAGWTLSATGPTDFSGPGPSVSSGSGFQPGTYDLSESGGPAGYAASAWSCVGGSQLDGDTIKLAAGDNATCTITNDDIGPTLKLIKTIVNDNGGSVTDPNDFGLRIDGDLVTHNTTYFLTAGDHHASEDGLPGYLSGYWGGDCTPDGSVTLQPGQAAVCTITNYDVVTDFQINAGHSGAWNRPLTNQGILIDIGPPSQDMFIAWFTYTDAESENPFEHRWLTAQGKYSEGTAVLLLNESLGGRFDDPQPASTNPVGEVKLDFFDCETAEMTYRFYDTDEQGTIELGRTIPGSENVCLEQSSYSTQAVDINTGMDGAWYDPFTSGQGFLIDAHTNPEGGNFIFVAWFTYGDDTASGQRWLTAQGNFAGPTAEIDITETTGGSFDDTLPTTRETVGTMRIDFEDCSNARFSYSLPRDNAENQIETIRLLAGEEALCEEIAGPE